ncbi:MAG TPA: SDR family NAD(P)-dependent oxidoreductase [Spongiibacteraceae bacterium]|jgi:NAD(P)-dependent dehydrogenase (short-subunit alcohol dehydrogenase family)|nr:SDR family NAD(P)-dependent oxidoreductase [Spongiibacteraceae bacterium]HUH37213.1 SDR family NAD(P)-dependent oxidoreductase [Spongiibacteraceae bacterium]
MGILQGKVALVTGAGQGVGQGIALALAGEGARIAVVGRTQRTLDDTVKRIRERGGEARAFLCDVMDGEQVARCITDVHAHFGAINILINNAQVVPLGRLLDISEDQYQQGMDSGPLATLRFMRGCYPYLKGDGIVVNMGSSSAIRWDPIGYGAYTAAKEAIRALTRAAACEWGPDGIRVNCVLPLALSPAMDDWRKERPEESTAFLSTIPLGRVGDCETDIGRAVVFLCGPDSAYLTGHSIPLDGGQAFMR